MKHSYLDMSYREATKLHSKMAGVALGGRLYCRHCKKHRPMEKGCKRKPHFICHTCAKEMQNEKAVVVVQNP